MILTCPDCDTRYTVDDAALGGTGGRDVRCTKCGKVWHYSPDQAARREPVAEIASAALGPAITTADSPPPSRVPPAPSPPPPVPTIERLRAEPRVEPPPPAISPPAIGPPFPPGVSPPSRGLREPVLDRGSGKAEKPAAARHRNFRIAGLALTGLMLVLVLLAIGARDMVMKTWPSTASLYRGARLADAVGAGLQVTVNPARTPDSLVVNGKITNTASSAREIPRLRVALRDDKNAEVASQVIDPPRNSLAPGATTAFSTVFKNPDSAATGVAVTFAAR
jgi:predicted Zn finger-like uncharacterized protein